jgi:hypothetical protein
MVNKKSVTFFLALCGVVTVLVFGLFKTSLYESFFEGKTKYWSGYIVPERPDSNQEFLTGRTFWRLDYGGYRTYFAPDQTVFFQYMTDDIDSHKTGDIVKGSWKIEGDQLCMNFNESIEWQGCFIYAIHYADKGIPGYMDYLTLIDSRPFLTKVLFQYDRQMEGNLLFQPDFSPLAKRALVEMDDIYEDITLGRFDHDRSPIEEISKLDSVTKNYLNLLYDTIQSTPTVYLSLKKDGTYSFIFKGHHEKYKDNIKKMKKQVQQGRWWIIDNKYHCFGTELDSKDGEDASVSCHLVLPPSVLIDHNADDLFVTHSTYKFTVKHPKDKFIPIEDFPNAEIFE